MRMCRKNDGHTLDSQHSVVQFVISGIRHGV
jgi:hypothetical protein